MSLAIDLITQDAAYLAECIEEFRNSADGNVSIPLSSAELLLKNYLRILGLFPKSQQSSPIVSAEESLTALMARNQEWIVKMKAQQEEAAQALKNLVPPRPPVTGAS